jgi:hypothetical protein
LSAQVTVTGPKAAIVGAVLQPATVGDLVEEGVRTVEGDEKVLETYAGVLDEFDKSFAIGTPERAADLHPDTAPARGGDDVLRLGFDMGVRLSAATLRRIASLVPGPARSASASVVRRGGR